tara:strand:+ start:552 stop:1100 length:549 start_codon:yes stop_codon:yes gene_type:complete
VKLKKLLKNISSYVLQYIIGLFYSTPKISYLGFLEGVIYSNSIFHIQLNCKGAYLVKINGKNYPVQTLYAFKSNSQDLTFEIEVKGVYKSFSKYISIPVQVVEPKVPSSKLNKYLGLKQSINGVSNQKISVLKTNLNDYEISNKTLYLNKIYRKSESPNKTKLIQKKSIYAELKNYLKNEKI